MIICINCNSDTKEKMDSLLKENQYKDYGELVSVAVENIWILNRELGNKGALVISDGKAAFSIPVKSPSIEKIKPINEGKSTSSSPSIEKANGISNKHDSNEQFNIPELFSSGGLDKLSVSTVDIPPNENADTIFTLDRWLFGQYNKLLPAKVNCRALVRLAAGSKKGAPLDQTAALIASAALQLGDYLADYDRRYQIGRDDALSTAFPHSGPDSEKSSSRYVNQFIGNVNSQNNLSGLLLDYRFIILSLEDDPHLLPTSQALLFAKLMNPILDGCQTGQSQKFSTEEISFLMKHIFSFVPVEAFAFRTLILAINNGGDTPEKLDEALRFLIPNDPKHKFSPSFLTSQRSGALSRMADLNLIMRERKGVRVSYKVTKQGNDLLDSN